MSAPVKECPPGDLEPREALRSRRAGTRAGRAHPQRHPFRNSPFRYRRAFCCPPPGQPRLGRRGDAPPQGLWAEQQAALLCGHQLCHRGHRAAMAGEYRLLLANARQLVLVCGHGEQYLLREGMARLDVLHDASLVVGLWVLWGGLGGGSASLGRCWAGELVPQELCQRFGA